jgi:hypothetical protein
MVQVTPRLYERAKPTEISNGKELVIYIETTLAVERVITCATPKFVNEPFT